jgi:hypothetical protein
LLARLNQAVAAFLGLTVPRAAVAGARIAVVAGLARVFGAVATGGLELADGGAAVARLDVAVIALFAAIDDEVAAGG